MEIYPNNFVMLVFLMLDPSARDVHMNKLSDLPYKRWQKYKGSYAGGQFIWNLLKRAWNEH